MNEMIWTLAQHNRGEFAPVGHKHYTYLRSLQVRGKILTLEMKESLR